MSFILLNKSTEISKWLQRTIRLVSYIGYKYKYGILYYVNTLARYALSPFKQVLSLTKQLLQFLWSIRYKTSETNKNNLTALADAAFANRRDLKSQFSNMYFLNGNLVGARSSKPIVTYSSSAESEIYSLSETISRLRNLTVLIQALLGNNYKCSMLTDSQINLHQAKVENIFKIKNKFHSTKVLHSKKKLRIKV